MGKTTIEWAHFTFNPWTRCTRVSPACDNCYAETWAGRATHPKDADGKALPLWGADAPRDPTSAHNWRQPLKWNRDAEVAGEWKRVVCASLADVFEDHPAITASGARERLWDLIEATTWLDWMLLTKRPENIMTMVPERWRAGLPANIWIGTTAESQEWAAKRIPHLRRVPAVVRFLSIEPMVGPVDLDPPTCPMCGGHEWVAGSDGATPFCPEHSTEMAFGAWLDPCADARQAGINLVIVGGESGGNARPLHPAWARALRDQCAEAGVAFHFKQWGEWAITEAQPGGDLGGDMRRGVVRIVKPEGENDGHFRKGDAMMRRVGKKTAGRLLDGRTWDEMPPAREPAS